MTPSNLTRPNLTLDEQSFQGLLSAAFIIQEHNARRKQALEAEAEEIEADVKAESEAETEIVCPHCGAPKPAEELRCQSCGQDELRPGERMQRNWASMWLMSQEQGLWPERSAEADEATPEFRRVTPKVAPGVVPRVTPKDAAPTSSLRTPLTQAESDFAETDLLSLPMVNEFASETIAPETYDVGRNRISDQSVRSKSALEDPALRILPAEKPATENHWIVRPTAAHPTTAQATSDLLQDNSQPEDLLREDSALIVQPLQLPASDDSYPIAVSPTDANPTDANLTDASEADNSSLLRRFADLHVTLRFHRADLYLGLAVLVAAFALLWPASRASRQPSLGLWERTLISLGIAEAPAPAMHFYGDPTIEVWVDPHTALYYCPGEEQYGKTRDGRFNSQRDAQMDRFEPASRSACE